MEQISSNYTNLEFDSPILLTPDQLKVQKKLLCTPCPPFRQDYQLLWYDPKIKTTENQVYLSTLMNLGFNKIKTFSNHQLYQNYL